MAELGHAIINGACHKSDVAVAAKTAAARAIAVCHGGFMIGLVLLGEKRHPPEAHR